MGSGLGAGSTSLHLISPDCWTCCGGDWGCCVIYAWNVFLEARQQRESQEYNNSTGAAVGSLPTCNTPSSSRGVIRETPLYGDQGILRQGLQNGQGKQDATFRTFVT